MIKQRIILMGILALVISTVSAPAFAADSKAKEKALTVKEQNQMFQELSKRSISADKSLLSQHTAVKRKVSKRTNQYPTRKGVILVTKDTVHKAAGMVGHAAIVYSRTKIIESTIDGVKQGNNNWNKKKSCWAGTVKKTTAKQDAAAASWCWKQAGKPYNYNFFNTKCRNKFYCSQLVYAAFLDKYKVNLNYKGGIVYPADLLRDSSKTAITYKKGHL